MLQDPPPSLEELRRDTTRMLRRTYAAMAAIGLLTAWRFGLHHYPIRVALMTLGKPASGVVDHVYDSSRRTYGSRVGVNFQYAPGDAPRSDAPATRERAAALKKMDRVAIHYLRGASWLIVLDDDGGFARERLKAGGGIMLFAIAVVALSEKFKRR